MKELLLIAVASAIVNNVVLSQFLVLACLVAVMNIVRAKMEAKGKPLAAPSGCLTGDCASCGQSAMCTGRLNSGADAAAKASAAKAAAKTADKTE